jgi:hypothetical protein
MKASIILMAICVSPIFAQQRPPQTQHGPNQGKMRPMEMPTGQQMQQAEQLHKKMQQMTPPQRQKMMRLMSPQMRQMMQQRNGQPNAQPNGKQAGPNQAEQKKPELSPAQQRVMRAEMYKRMMKYRRAQAVAKPNAEEIAKLREQVGQMHEQVIGENLATCPFGYKKCEFCKEILVQRQAKQGRGMQGQRGMQGHGMRGQRGMQGQHGGGGRR